MEAMARLVWLLLLPATIYLGSMALHLKLLPFAGRGDSFHPKPFRCRLGLAPRRDPDTGAVLGPATPQADCIAAGCAACRGQFPLSLPAAISSLNARMLSANAGIKKQHTFSSGWAHWPFGSQPVFYWSSTKCYADHYCRIYMAANPLVWGVGLTGLAALLLLLLGRASLGRLCRAERLVSAATSAAPRARIVAPEARELQRAAIGVGGTVRRQLRHPLPKVPVRDAVDALHAAAHVVRHPADQVERGAAEEHAEEGGRPGPAIALRCRAATDRAGGGGADREVVLEAAAGGFGEDRLWDGLVADEADDHRAARRAPREGEKHPLRLVARRGHAPRRRRQRSERRALLPASL
mmetsp:Transcript_27266/g.81193  ORF Transcript_27266/g.81193 Transcript_27266/m.81193 type:complete len:352 (+) Transcript_27266:1-1056(+)